MKKIILIFIITLTTFSLWGCSKNQLSKSDLFNKKQECAKFIDNEKNWLYDFTAMDYNHRWNYVNKYGEIWIERGKSEVLEIFYSKKINSCVSIIKIAYNIDMWWSFRYIIRDILNNTNIWDYFNWDYYNALVDENWDGKYDLGESINYPRECNKESEANHCKEYNKKIKELKWE